MRIGRDLIGEQLGVATKRVGGMGCKGKGDDCRARGNNCKDFEAPMLKVGVLGVEQGDCFMVWFCRWQSG